MSRLRGTKRKPKVLLIGYYFRGNIGDDAILSVLCSRITPYADISVVVPEGCITEDRDVDYRIIEIGIIRKKIISKLNFVYHALQMMRISSSYDALVFGGGTQIFETKRSGWIPLLRKYLYLRFYKSIASRPGKVIHAFVGINKPRTKIGSWLTREILALSDLVIVRDENSYSLCRAMGVSTYRLVLSTDCVYGIEISNEVKISLEKSEKNNRRLHIGLSLFPYFAKNERLAIKDEEIARKVGLLIGRVATAWSESSDQGVCISILSNQSDANSVDEKGLVESFSSLVPHEVRYINYSGDLNLTLASLSTIDLAIGMRLHFLILSAIMGVDRIVGIEYQEKVTREIVSLHIPSIDSLSASSTVSSWSKELITQKTGACEEGFRILLFALSEVV